MAAKKDETASFMIRFTQKIYRSEDGEPQIQWRGNINHVQSGDEKRFSDFEKAAGFIREKLAELTVTAMENKSPEEQKGILAKSFDMWKRMAAETPKMVVETIKDPRKGIAQIQSQINQVGEVINSKIEDAKDNLPDLTDIRGAGREEHDEIMSKLEEMSKQIAALNEKVK